MSLLRPLSSQILGPKVNWCTNKSQVKYPSTSTCQVSPEVRSTMAEINILIFVLQFLFSTQTNPKAQFTSNVSGSIRVDAWKDYNAEYLLETKPFKSKHVSIITRGNFLADFHLLSSPRKPFVPTLRTLCNYGKLECTTQAKL